MSRIHDRFSCVDVARAARLEGGRKSGHELRYRCPNHADRDPSLSINPDKDAWLCGPCGASGNAWTLAAFLSGIDPSETRELLRWCEERGLVSSNQNGTHSRKITATYDYVDETGTLLFQVVRTHPKGFYQRRPDGNGGWITTLGTVRRVPYRLPQLISAPEDAEIHINEGEKDTENFATTNAEGAKRWQEEFVRFFKPTQRIVIHEDNDAEDVDGRRLSRDHCFARSPPSRCSHSPDCQKKAIFRLGSKMAERSNSCRH
jgi:putative DNA primase/helicase